MELPKDKIYVASISYGKDSLAMLHVIRDVLDWPLDRIITSEVWATDTIPADLPPMVEFKAKADRIIKERWGIEVEHFCATNKQGEKITFQSLFYHIRTHSKDAAHQGQIYGWPCRFNPWCNSMLKIKALNFARQNAKGCVEYLGIAADEPKRITRHSKKPLVKMPLVQAGWTEEQCKAWCKANNLLSPIYASSNRGGCWFCHNQSISQLRVLRKEYPRLWELMLEMDKDTPTMNSPFMAGHTVHDIDRRFRWEDEGYIPTGKRFRWSDTEEAQMNIFQFIGKDGEA